MQAIRDIFDLWPTVVAMAGDVGVKTDRARKWKLSGRIPSDSIFAVAKAVQAKGVNLTPEQILLLNSSMRRRGRPPIKRRARVRKNGRHESRPA